MWITVRTRSDHKIPGRFAPRILRLWRGNGRIGWVDSMKCVQIAYDYCWLYGVICASLLSPLAMAEWIEIECKPLRCHCFPVSASDGGVDWNSLVLNHGIVVFRSSPAISEWIEIHPQPWTSQFCRCFRQRWQCAFKIVRLLQIWTVEGTTSVMSECIRFT